MHVHLQVRDTLLEVLLELPGGHEMVQIWSSFAWRHWLGLLCGCPLFRMNQCCLLVLHSDRCYSADILQDAQMHSCLATTLQEDSGQQNNSHEVYEAC